MPMAMSVSELGVALSSQPPTVTYMSEHVFNEPPESIPPPLQSILQIAFTDLTEEQIAVLHSYFQDPVELQFFATYEAQPGPRGLEQMWHDLEVHCLEGAKPAIFSFKMSDEPQPDIDSNLVGGALLVTISYPQSKINLIPRPANG